MYDRANFLRGKTALLRESSSSSPRSQPSPNAGGPSAATHCRASQTAAIAGVDAGLGVGVGGQGECEGEWGSSRKGSPGNNLATAVLRPGHARPHNAHPRIPAWSSSSRKKQEERGGGGGGGLLLVLVLLLGLTALGTIGVTMTAGQVFGAGGPRAGTGAGAGARRRDRNGDRSGDSAWWRGAASLEAEITGKGAGAGAAEREAKGASGSGVQDYQASSIDLILPLGNPEEAMDRAAKRSQVEAEHKPLEVKKKGDTAERCKGYEEEYGIVPEQSWGAAPFKIQELWKALKCDRVLAEDGFSLEDPPTDGRSRAIVLVWNKIAGWLSFLTPAFVKAARETCPTECVFTNDQDVLQKASGVLFHGSTHRKTDFPKTKPFGTKYVWVNLEPTTYAPVQNLLKDSKYMSRFDLTMTYQRNSDIPVGYVGSNPASYYFKAPRRPFEAKDGFGAPDAIAAFVSNCRAAGAPKRLRYMEELMKHTTVHSFGGCLHNRDEPDLSARKGNTNRQENKIAVLTRYKFLLAFENDDDLEDYVTEKVYNGFQSGTLPVYWGAANVDDYVPKGSIVKASDFDGPEELAKHLKRLAVDEEAYEAYFKWKEDPDEEKRFDQEVVARSAYSVNAMCRLCDKVMEQQRR